jgi:hypothetical protein
MASQGPNSGSTFGNDATVGNTDWTDPQNAHSSDEVYATVNLTAPAPISHYLKATNFGFSIPTGATINGIQVDCQRKEAIANQVIDNSAKIVKADTIQGDENASGNFWPTTEAYATYGGSSNLWGLSWTRADINASNFGFVISAKRAAGGSQLASIDHIRITVTYTITAYTLSAEGGSYSITGQTAALKAARKLPASPGSYTLTGQAAALRAARKIAVESGSYLLTGQTAILRSIRKMAAEEGSYVLTGQAVALKLARKIAAGAGSYSLTGQDAVLRAIRKMTAQGGSYVYAGQAANLVIGQHYILVAEAGSYGEPYSKIFVTLDGRIYKKMGNAYLRLS